MGGFTRGGSLLLTVPSASGRSTASYTTPPILGQSTSPLSMRVIRSVRCVPVRSPCSKLAPPSVNSRRPPPKGDREGRSASTPRSVASGGRTHSAPPVRRTWHLSLCQVRHKASHRPIAEGGKTAGATSLHGPD